MKKRKVASLALAFAMLCSVALAGCDSNDTSTSETTASEVTESEVEETTEKQGFVPPKPVVSVPDVPDGVPAVIEDFSGDTNTAIARGDTVALDIVDSDTGKALKISGRTDSWNGANFNCDFFAGNTIRVEASVKADAGSAIISIQYDSYGTTVYNNLTTINGCGSSYVSGVANFDVPVGVTNVYVYVEGGDTSDLYVDYIFATCQGDYVAPNLSTELADTSDYESLAELYNDYFKMGVAIPNSMVDNEDLISFVKQEFNSITLENELKPDSVLDAEKCLADPETYNENPAITFDNAKAALDYAQANGIQVRGHVLVWHSQTPDWFFYENYDVNGELASRELMLTRMENYIKNVFEYVDANYPGLFYAYDVVNEAIGDDNELRQSLWTETVGDDFIFKAFEFARKYAPEGVDLFYNDYNEYVPAKQDKILEYLKPIAEAGNIDGFGMQSHINTGITAQQYVEVLKKYHDELGVKIHITELDVKQSTVSFNPEYDQGVFYMQLFSELIATKEAGYPIESVTVWGISDTNSWRASELPLLFNGDLSQKDAFRGVVCAVTGDELEKPADYREPLTAGDPISEDFEGDSYYGNARISATLEVIDEGYEGKCLEVSGGTAEYDGYSIDVTRFLGTTIKYYLVVKSDASEVHFVADIDGSWPWLSNADTSSGDWVVVEGTYDVPSDLASLSLYVESVDMSSFCIDSISIEAA